MRTLKQRGGTIGGFAGFRRAAWMASLAVSGLVLLAAVARADAPRALSEGRLPADRRSGDLKDLNGYFPFHPPASRDEWSRRSDELRRQLLVALGLWPMPGKTPANAVVHGRIDRDDFTVERVFLESFPGHFVTGSLFRPKGRSGKLPGVLCPHGHWPNGRFYDQGPKEIRQSIVDGAERFELSGRYPLQARCIQLARMGCVVFHYDMVGYADSVQLPHGPGYRPAMSKPEAWGYFSPQAEVHAQNMMGLQTYNSIRALDWFAQLPDVDPARIGVTGASGGGTQTFMLMAVDPRPAVAFPAVMVGTAMQGGCTCENACNLRVNTGNVEITALAAPRPVGMSAADDWTKEIMTKGLPELKRLYALFGVDGNVDAKPLLHFPHNYNQPSRAAMYAWMSRNMKLGVEPPVVERDFAPLSVKELSVWDEKHPKPAGGDAYELSLLKWITADSQKQIEALVPCDAASLARYRQVVGGAVQSLVGRTLPKAGEVKSADAKTKVSDAYRITTMLLRYDAQKEELPAVLIEPKGEFDEVVVRIESAGKRSLFDAAGNPSPETQKALAHKAAVLGIDLLGLGEFTADGKPWAKARLLKTSGWERFLGYTLGYNTSLFAQRVHDVLSAVSYAKATWPHKRVTLVGVRGGGPWAAVARAIAGNAIDRAVIDTQGFRFAKITSLDDPNLLPGGAKYLDLPGILALSAPGDLLLTGEGQHAPAVVAAAYKAAGKPERLKVFGAPHH